MSDIDLDAIEELEDETSDDYVRLKKSDVKQLRSAAKAKGTAERELAGYKRQDAVRKAGLKGLTERQIAVLAREAGDDQSPEALKQIATELGFPVNTEPSEDEQEQQQIEDEMQQQEDAAAVGTGGQSPTARTGITPEEINGWPSDRLMRLQQQHPDTYESVLRGDPITLPPGFN